MFVKGGVGKIVEYTDESVKTLSVPERATITNKGAELGATTSIFPSDEITRQFLKAQKREEFWSEQSADGQMQKKAVLCQAFPRLVLYFRLKDDIGIKDIFQ